VSVLVTGATGFIGTNFCETETRLSLFKLSSHIRINESSRLNRALGKELEGHSVVLHLAGLAHNNYSVQELHRINHLGTLELATAAGQAGVKRFIFLSTVNVHGSFSGEYPFTETSDLDESLSQLKIATEKGLVDIGADTGMEITIVRSVLVYGKDAPGNVGRLNKLVSILRISPFGLIRNKKSLISVANLCDFLYTCCIHAKAGDEVFLVSDDDVVSTPELLSSIALGLGRKIYHLPVPVRVLSFLGGLCSRSKQVEQLIVNLEVDCSKARSLLGWSPLETMAQAMAKLK
jgi:nucleoside-diphosphate-sugar epimerase